MNITYKIFKPENPIDYDGERTYPSSLLKKIILIYSDFLKKKKYNQELILRLLIIFKSLIIKILIILYFPLSLLVYLTKYRFLWINSWQIGAYIQELETVLKYNKLYKKKKIIFLCPKFLLINNFIHKIYSKDIILINNFFIYLLLYPFIHTTFISFTNWSAETTNPQSKFNQLHENFKAKFGTYSFKKEYQLKFEKKYIKNLKSKYNLLNFKKVIVIQNRDNFFYDSPQTRNSNIYDYKKIISDLLKKKFTVIRFKSLKSPSLIIKNKSYLELNIQSEQDKIDQFLICKYSRLIIVCQGGISAYDYIFKTSFLLINAIPININALIKNNDKIILKKFFDKKDKKIVRFSEIFKRNLHLNTSANRLFNERIQLVNNSPKEIYLAVLEILNKKNKSSLKYLKFVPDHISFKYSKASIAKSFLIKNKLMF